MKFYQHLYFTDKLDGNIKKIKQNIRKRKLLPDYIVIVLCDGKDQLEYFHSALLHQDYYKKNELIIIGIGKDEEDALAIIQMILKDSQNAGFEYKMKDYICSSTSDHK